LKGVSRFIFIVWDSREGPLWRDVESRCHGFDTILIESNAGTFNAESDAMGHNSIRSTYVSANDWYVICDLDEFHDPGGYSNFHEAIAAARMTGATAICGVLLDRISSDGHIHSALDLNKSLGAQFPLACNVIGSMARATRKKILMARNDIEITPGHHVCRGILWDNECRVHHFKWFGRVIHETSTRLVSYERQNLYYAHQSRRLFECFKKNANMIPINDPKLDASLVDNDPLARLMVPRGVNDGTYL